MLIEGDVFKATQDVLIHGANCFNTFGSGVAKQVKLLYPGAWEEDQKTIKGDESKLGTFTVWAGTHSYYDQTLFVVNLYTQYRYGTDKMYVDYDAVRTGLENVYETFPFQTIAMPMIGAGLAGGDWNIINDNINEVFKEQELVIYKWK